MVHPSSSHGGGSVNGGNNSCSSLKKGPWTAAEDAILMEYVKKHGEGNWNAVQKNSGLSRCGKSCRLRWANHLRPNLKKGSFSIEEERIILELHAQYGNKWARMASQLPGRTDNEIKNYWNTRIKRRQRAGLPLYPPEIQRSTPNYHTVRQNFSPQMAPTTLQYSSHVSSPLSLPNPNTFSVTTTSLFNHPNALISSPIPQFKRIIGGDNFGYSLPLSSPLFHQLHPSTVDSNPSFLSTAMQAEVFPLTSDFVMKVELPSVQFPIQNEAIGINDGGLLDSMWKDSHEGTGGRDELKESILEERQKNTVNAFVCEGPSIEIAINDMSVPTAESSNLWDYSISASSSMGIEMKKEQVDETNSVEISGDLSTLLGIPTTDPITQSNSVGGSSKQGVMDDDFGLEMQQLTLSFSSPDHDWNLGSCPWNNMPGIC